MKSHMIQESRPTGYEIQYSTYRDFTKNTVKTVTIKNKATVKKTITGLKAQKTCYVRMRSRRFYECGLSSYE